MGVCREAVAPGGGRRTLAQSLWERGVGEDVCTEGSSCAQDTAEFGSARAQGKKGPIGSGDGEARE
jgi:hypothetical protein